MISAKNISGSVLIQVVWCVSLFVTQCSVPRHGSSWQEAH